MLDASQSQAVVLLLNDEMQYMQSWFYHQLTIISALKS